MKTETQIAKESIEGIERWDIKEFAIKSKYEAITHKASCQGFLEFLKDVTGIDEVENIRLKHKITDLKQAIKLYEDAGI